MNKAPRHVISMTALHFSLIITLVLVIIILIVGCNLAGDYNTLGQPASPREPQALATPSTFSPKSLGDSTFAFNSQTFIQIPPSRSIGASSTYTVKLISLENEDKDGYGSLFSIVIDDIKSLSSQTDISISWGVYHLKDKDTIELYYPYTFKRSIMSGAQDPYYSEFGSVYTEQKNAFAGDHSITQTATELTIGSDSYIPLATEIDRILALPLAEVSDGKGDVTQALSSNAFQDVVLARYIYLMQMSSATLHTGWGGGGELLLLTQQAVLAKLGGVAIASNVDTTYYSKGLYQGTSYQVQYSPGISVHKEYLGLNDGYRIFSNIVSLKADNDTWDYSLEIDRRSPDGWLGGQGNYRFYDSNDDYTEIIFSYGNKRSQRVQVTDLLFTENPPADPFNSATTVGLDFGSSTPKKGLGAIGSSTTVDTNTYISTTLFNPGNLDLK